MSYCRFSSDDFQCDLYSYEDCNGGFTTWVARVKHVLSEPLPPPMPWSKEGHDAWIARAKEVRRILDASPLVPIGLSEDGGHFHDDTADALLRRIEWLRSLGYRCPDSTLEVIREEIQEGGE